MEGRAHTKILAAVLIFSIAASTVSMTFPQKVEAQASCASAALVALGKKIFNTVTGAAVPITNSTVETSTTGTYIKDCVLTPIAVSIARSMVRNISNSIVNWINNDFQGRPAFDIEGALTDSVDQAIGGFIYGSDLGFLCQPFSARIRLALATKYSSSFREEIRCTLTDIRNNVNGFANNNGGAGWDNWLRITTEPQNNVYGAYLMAESELASNIQGQLNKINAMANRNGGFLDYKVCDNNVLPPERETGAQASLRVSEAQELQKRGEKVDPRDLDPTPKCKTGGRSVTPGSLVQEQAATVLGGWSEQLNLATEIDQVVGALISHFTEKMITSATGFLGLSSPGGYARTGVSANQALAASSDLTNPENTGLNTATQAFENNTNFLPSESPNENAALGMTVTSSRDPQNLEFATDGDPNTTAITGDGLQSWSTDFWMEVDLGILRNIAEIRIWPAPGESVKKSIGTITPVISDRPGDRDLIGRTFISNDGSLSPVVLPIHQIGRTVRIERTNNIYECEEDTNVPCSYALSVGEIEVILEESESSE